MTREQMEKDIRGITEILGGSLEVFDFAVVGPARWEVGIYTCYGYCVASAGGETYRGALRKLHAQLRRVAIAFLSYEYDFTQPKDAP